LVLNSVGLAMTFPSSDTTSSSCESTSPHCMMLVRAQKDELVLEHVSESTRMFMGLCTALAR
jgi:hypothetical protein